MYDIDSLERRCSQEPDLLASLISDPVGCLRSMGMDLSDERAAEISHAFNLGKRIPRSQDLDDVAVAVGAS